MDPSWANKINKCTQQTHTRAPCLPQQVDCFSNIIHPGSLTMFNIAPENQWLEDVFPLEIHSPFLGAMLNFRRVSGHY